jgi:hypothetical protein
MKGTIMKKVVIEYNDKELWTVKMTGLITPRDLTRLIRAVKVQYRYYLREQKLQSLTESKKAISNGNKETDTKMKGNLEHGN